MALASLFMATGASANTEFEYYGLCKDGDIKYNALPGGDEKISLTELSITAKGKSVCTHGFVNGRHEADDYVLLGINRETMFCRQETDETRLNSIKFNKPLVRRNIRGEFWKIIGGKAVLKNCEIDPITDPDD